jgi:hypothetical protein
MSSLNYQQQTSSMGFLGDHECDDSYDRGDRYHRYKPIKIITCKRCFQTGHKTNVCPSKATPQVKVTTCKLCSMTGHRTNACPTKPVQAKADKDTCRRCGITGHSARECSLPPKRQH